MPNVQFSQALGQQEPAVITCCKIINLAIMREDTEAPFCGKIKEAHFGVILSCTYRRGEIART
ncbi:hypothetical protein ACC805_29975 [Rhizobium ruizarguesonis]